MEKVKYKEIVEFHGHECPGLAIGYRMAQAAMEELRSLRAEDEELVAIVENDACGVDALQCVTGCTFGKGNLIFHDYGKPVYTVYSRKTGKGVRVVFRRDEVPEDLLDDRMGFLSWILEAQADAILRVSRVHIDEPEPARIMESIACEKCGESVMVSRLRKVCGTSVCIPCAEKSNSPKEI